MIMKVLEEGLSVIASKDMVIECNNNDKNMVNKIISDYTKTNGDYRITISQNSFNFIGGIRVKSADGLMSYDGTIDSKIERIKPIIRKDIAQLLRG